MERASERERQEACIDHIDSYKIGRRFAAALLPRLFGKNPRSHHKGATGRVRTGDQRLPVLCHCQLGQDNIINILIIMAMSEAAPGQGHDGPL